MGNGKVKLKDAMPKETAKEQAAKEFERLLDSKYGDAILPGGSGRDGRLAVQDFRSHQPLMFKLFNVPSKIDANAAIAEMKRDFGAAIQKFDPGSRGIEFLEVRESSYDPKLKELSFSLVLRIDETALRQRWGQRLGLAAKKQEGNKGE
jgi:hypothetical protein